MRRAWHIVPTTGSSAAPRSYDGLVSVSIVFFVIIALAFAIIAGTVLYGIALAVFGWVGSVAETARDSVSRYSRTVPQVGAGTPADRAVINADPDSGRLPVYSADDLWAQMQGRPQPKKSRPGGRPG